MLILLRWWNWGTVLLCLGLLWWALRRDEGNEWVQWGCPNRCRGLGLAPQHVYRLLVGAQKCSISMESWLTVPCPMISSLTARAERPRVHGRGSRILRSRNSRWGRIRWIRTKCSLRASTENVSLLATGKTSSGQIIPALATGITLWWLILVSKKGLDCLLIRIPFYCCIYSNTLQHGWSYIFTLPYIIN